MVDKINNLYQRKKIIRILWMIILWTIIYLIINYRLYDKPGLYLADEFGFISAPAYMSGFDWSDQISNISYYGIGYGLLIIPGFYICKTVQQLTIYIQVINILLLFCAVTLCYQLLYKLFSRENFIKVGVCTIAVSVYISNICFLQMGWSESMNLVLYWLILNLLYEVIKGGKLFKLLMLAVVLCYAVIVHMRNISIVAACVVSLAWWQIKLKKFNCKKIIAFFVVIIIGIIVFYGSKQYIQMNLYEVSNEQNQQNDVAFVINAGKNQIESLGIVQVIKNFIVSILGKIFYQLSVTYGIIIFGIWGIVTYLKKRENNEKMAVLICSLLMFAFSLLLCSYSMMSPARLDNIFYGRYVETTIGLLIAVGLLCLSNMDYLTIMKIDILFLLLYKVLLFSTTKKYSEMLSNSFIQGFVFQCSPGIAKYYLSGDIPNIIEKVCRQTLTIFVFLGTVSLIVGYCRKYCKKNLAIIMIGLIASSLSFVWMKDSQIVVDGILSYEGGYYRDAEKVLDNTNDEIILDYIESDWSENDRCQIYYYTNNIWNDHLLVLQYKIGKTPIININTLEDLKDSQNSDIYVLLDMKDEYESKKSELEKSNFQYQCSTREFVLYAKLKH